MKLKLHGVALFISLLLIVNQARAQQNLISGKIKSSDNQQPLHGVNIGIDGKGIGTATNRNGEFVLLVPAANIKDSLKISYIGYQTKRLAIADMQAGIPVNISLEKTTVALKEVGVEYHNPLKVIEKAIARIPVNYIDHPHVTRGFYRMFTAKGTDPLELSEAVFDIYNFGYSDKRADLFKLIKARDEKNQRDFHSLELGQKPNNIFNYDVVNHLMSSGFLSENGMKKHKFEYAGMVDVRGYPAYEIDFKEVTGAKDESFRGKFYVDAKSYAFIYFDYGLSPVGLEEVKLGNFVQRVLTGVAGITVEMQHDRTRVGYQKVADKWVLSDVVGDDALAIKSDEFNYDYVADVKFNYQVTAVDTTQTASFDTKMDRHANINDHNSNDGEEYWKNYNILLADYNTEDVFKQIQAINGQTKLKDKFEEKLNKMPKDSLQRIEALLNFYHDNGQFNGTALIKDKGKILLSKSYGYADKQAKTPANEHTVYNIGGAAQTFTSVIINQLAAEGKLDVHAPLKRYMPYYKNDSVTTGQLLAHQAGIPDFLTNEDYKTQVMTKPFTLKDMVINFCSDSLSFPPGTGVEYSNSNFVVLALLAQDVSGKPFNTLLQERIFTPLQMTDTYFGAYRGTDNRLATGDAGSTPAMSPYDAANLAGTGGIFSSAADMLKYHNALLANQLLAKENKEEMLKPRVEYQASNTWFSYGWMTDKNGFEASKKHVITYHPGSEGGFSTMFARQEDSDNCIILLSNASAFPQYDITDLIFTILN